MATVPEVLIVDDSPIMREIVEFNLKALGIERIHNAGSGEEAYQLLQHQRFDLILSDWSMSGMSGLDLLVKVRLDGRLAKTPFILVTGEMQRDMLAQAARAGVNDFLLKPIKPEEFASKVQKVFSGQSRSAEQKIHGVPNACDVPARLTRQATLLLVDDTPQNLTLASNVLRDDYQVKVATDGEKALQICKTSPPDLILLDIMMPVMDGFEVCRRLKADTTLAHIPIIFLTALDDVGKTVEGLELGAVDYVNKPFTPAILKARVATALRVSQAHEDLREHYDLMIENVRLREEVERIVRHDLKNPLSAIIGMAARLSRQDNLSSEQNKQVKAIERSAYDMLDLINCSSELFKMEQGDYCLQPHPVDLEALIERVAEESRLAFSGKEISFLNEIIPCCEEEGCKGFQGDPLMLYSMLHNLVKNAAEASRPGETVRLELVCGNPARIRIHNPGRVPAEVCGRFFEKYSTYGKQGGTGLGTYSAKLICEAHGGRIAMETSDEAGTVITVELPCTDHRL